MEDYAAMFDSEEETGDDGVAVKNYKNINGIAASELMSPPTVEGMNEEDEEEDGETFVNFKETVQHLEALTRFLVCIKCDKLPKAKVWTLGCCLHKYCEACAKILAGQPCLACSRSGYPKDAKPDLFASSILSEIPSVYMTMVRLEEMSCGNEGGVEDDLEEMEEELAEEVEIQKKTKSVSGLPLILRYEEEDMPLVECTPKGQGPDGAVSQDFPEVLEETPQNKVRGRPSLTAGTSRTSNLAIPSRILAFPSQEKTTTGCVRVAKDPSPEADFCSDEELFKSQPQPPRGDVSPGGIPILTPYANANKKPEAGRSSDEGAGRKTRARSSGEFDPPSLTPHQKVSEKVQNAEEEEEEGCPKPARRPRKASTSSSKSSSSTASRKSTRGRKAKEQQVEEKSVTAKVTRSDETPKVVVEKAGSKKKPATTSERKRHVSSTSNASSTSSGRNSVTPISAPGAGLKEKRNAKGETALHIACRAGVMEKVTSLVDARFDINAKDNAAWTPIHELINGKGTLSIKSDILRLLCEKGGDVNAIGGLEEVTPLHSAVLTGAETLVEILLDFGASPNIRDAEGRLPRDIAYNEVIVKLLEEKMGIVAGPSTTSAAPVNLNNSTFVSTTSMVEDDPAVMKVMLKKALIYFNYDVEPDVVKATKEKLALKVSDTLTSQVTHIIHHFKDKEERSLSRVALSMEYLFGLAHCMWQVSSDWITSSLKKGTCVVPTSYEILGHSQDAMVEEDSTPGFSRMNREKGNPGLLNGFSIYLYKTCSFSSPHLKLTKAQLADLIKGSGGAVINREPDPESIDPLEAPPRFHVINNSRGSSIDDDSNGNSDKFILTTHIILYDEQAPPPPSKRYSMEHVKSLKCAWLIDSLAHFRLEDPENYL